MLAQALPVIPPAPKVHAKDLPALRHLLTAQRNTIEIFPDYAFEVLLARRRLLGIDAVLVNDPAGVRHVLPTNAANYVRWGEGSHMRPVTTPTGSGKARHTLRVEGDRALAVAASSCLHGL